MSTMNLYCIFSGSSDLGYWIFVRFDIGLKQNIWVNMIQVWRRIRVRNMCCAAARLHTRHSSSPSQAPVSARCCDNVFMFCGNYLPTFTYKYRLLLRWQWQQGECHTALCYTLALVPVLVVLLKPQLHRNICSSECKYHSKSVHFRKSEWRLNSSISSRKMEVNDALKFT